MATREQKLKELTHKGDVEEIGRRAYYTPAPDNKEEPYPHFQRMALALLLEKLHEKEILSDDDLDEILLGAVY